MKPKSYRFTVTSVDEHKRLDQFLALRLPESLGVPLSKAKVRLLIMAGAVYLNKSRVKIASKPMRVGATVEAFVDLGRLQKDNASRQKDFEVTEERIIFEDSEIIVVDKPAGIPTQATVDTSRDHLYAAVIRYLSRSQGKLAYAGMHHRLDYDTSGLVLFSKARVANKWIADLFKSRDLEKTYHAIVLNPKSMANQWEIKNHIARAHKTGRVINMVEVKSGGDFAHTEFKKIGEHGDHALVECRPHTGRTHQIRVHLQQSGHPILGDALYGGPKDDRIYLHAHKLKFRHGSKGKTLELISPYPSEFRKKLGF